MKKKGFTLIELLAVIALLAVITTIALVSVSAINNAIKEEMLEKKLEMIKEAALLYSDNYKRTIIKAEEKYEDHSCMKITVNDLIPDYLDKDSDSCEENKCIVNPADENNYLDEVGIILYYHNSRIKAVVDIDNKLTCS